MDSGKLLKLLKKATEKTLKKIDSKNKSKVQIMTFIDPYGNEYRDEIHGNKINRYIKYKQPIEIIEIKCQVNIN